MNWKIERLQSLDESSQPFKKKCIATRERKIILILPVCLVNQEPTRISPGNPLMSKKDEWRRFILSFFK